MLRSASSPRGMVTAPHHLAAQAGLAVLRDGGNAIEAMVAAAATVAVVYPHMNSIGGDGFWLIKAPEREPFCILACGPAGLRASRDVYHQAGLGAISSRGPLAAITVAGCIGGWTKALAVSTRLDGRLPLRRLLEEAIWYAGHGFPMTGNQAETLAGKCNELIQVPGFADAFPPGGQAGEVFTQPRLAATLERLAGAGLEDFYRGELARSLARDLESAGSPLRVDDLESYEAMTVAPLAIKLSQGTVFNTPPPTQGLASLMILGLFDRLGISESDGFDHVHGLVEATKRAFLVRDREISDPAHMTSDPSSFLADGHLDILARRIDRRRAMPWPAAASKGDTVWLGAIDSTGLAVSYIQSIYWEFGSGVVLDETGVLWQNRGASFSLDPASRNVLAPGKRPFHTLSPALAVLNGERIMVYGTMGGEGQPQTQAAVFTRVAHSGCDLQAAITAPRWLLGRTWGAESTSLKLEAGFDVDLVGELASAGHIVEIVPAFSDVMGHAGGVIRLANGMLEGASDPRSNGCAAGY
jgi:oxamate amidohydrolase